MAGPVKYTFDQAFDGGAKNRYDVELEQIRVEAEQAKTVSLHQGIEQGRQQALDEIEEATRNTMNQMAQATHALFSQRNQLESNLKSEMVQLAYAIASKLSSSLVRSYPMAEVEAMIEDCMTIAHREPRLLVRVSEDMLDPINDRLEDMKASTGFPGDIVLIGEPELSPQDCKVEWPDGGSERKLSDIQKQIEDAVQRFVMSDGVEKTAYSVDIAASSAEVDAPDTNR